MFPLIKKYFPDLSSKQIQQFSQLQELYFSWNEKINLISRKDIEHLQERHILHSLAIAKVISFKPGTKILDIGTGGGFPGIPLAILFPDSMFHLVDSIGKKINVVREIIHSLGLKNIKGEQIRAEELKQQYDFAVCRAVAPLPEIIKWMKGKFKQKNFNDLPNGLLCFKGGNLTEEIRLIPTLSPKEKGTKNVEIFNLSGFFNEEFFETKKLVWVGM